MNTRVKPDWYGRVLQEIDAGRADLVRFLVDLVRMPSVSGSDVENSAQDHLARTFDDAGLEVDHWEVPLEQARAHRISPVWRSTARRLGVWSAGSPGAPAGRR